MRCRRRRGAVESSPSPAALAVQILLHTSGDILLPPSAFRQALRYLQEFPGGRAGLRLGQDGAEFRQHLVADSDLYDGPCVLVDAADQLGKAAARLTDGDPHRDLP